MERKIRVLVAKVGLDGHDRGAKVVANILRDAGFEVIYSGLHQTAENVVEAALQEDVDVIGVSSLAGAHMTIFSKILKLLDDAGAGNIVVTGGGIIPEDDIGALAEMGVGKLFTPGTPSGPIVEYIKEKVGKTRGSDGSNAR